MTGGKAADVAAEVGRSCGECDLCCVVHGVPGATVAGERCKYLKGVATLLDVQVADDTVDFVTTHEQQHGCSIYGKRPRMCNLWYCAWLLGIGDLDDRPDKTGVIPDFVGSVDQQAAGVRLAFGPADLYPDRARLARRALNLAARVIAGTAGAKWGWGPMQVVGPIGKVPHMVGGFDPRQRFADERHRRERNRRRKGK